MRKLLDFLIEKRHWFLFLLLEIVSLALLYYNSVYQQHVMFSTANVVTANIVSVSGTVSSYLDLREKNRALLERNVQLEMDNLRLQYQLEAMQADTVVFRNYVHDTHNEFPYDLITARVINNSVAYLSNYITLNKGRKDGITSDMGVISENGVVGIVSTVSDHYSVVIPLLNPKSRINGKVLGGSFGSMSWNGRSTRYANLNELPRHVPFEVGDTIVTSGHSTVFPEGLLVGTVSSFEKQHDDNFYSLEVKLSTDFHRLSTVMVIRNYNQAEQQQIEEEAKGNG